MADSYEDFQSLSFSDYDVVLFPISGLNDNMEIKTENRFASLPLSLFENLSSNTLFFTGLKTKVLLKLIPESQLISFLDFEEVQAVNNELTVEGTLAEVKDGNADSVCVIGYGKLGKELYWRLTDSGVKTFIISRPKELIYHDKVLNYYPITDKNILEVFKVCDMVINTIPYNIIPEEAFSCDYVPYILDIASFPYGVNQEIVNKYKDLDRYKLYLGIPSKFAPKEASDILLKTLKKVIDVK